MIFPVFFLSAIFLISASVGSEESCYLSEAQEDECASVCYPIVKPLLRYFEKSNERDAQLLKCRADYTELQKEGLKQYPQLSICQQEYSDLVKRHLEMENKYTEVLSQLSDEKVKYAQLHSKQQEVDNLINQKNNEIDLLKDQIRELKEKSELATLTNKFSKDIDKMGEIVKSGEVLTNQLANINNQTTPKTESIDFPDHCPRDQEDYLVLREIQLPGSDPFKVVCFTDSDIGSGWLYVYRKWYISNIFNVTYKDYESGFGHFGTDNDDEFFIGLNRLHHLTNGKPHEVLFYTFPKPRRCGNFVVGDRSEGYKVKNIGNCSGYDWIIPNQGSKFSTFDRDEDGVPGRNLAKEAGFGWWFDPSMSGMSTDETNIYMFIRRTD